MTRQGDRADTGSDTSVQTYITV